jgi:hypothetical protein
VGENQHLQKVIVITLRRIDDYHLPEDDNHHSHRRGNLKSYTEKDCFEKSQNYCSTGERTAELNIHLDPVSKKSCLA